MTDDELRHVGRLEFLEWLDLDETAITSDGVRHLRGLKRLKRLSIGHTPLDDRCAGVYWRAGRAWKICDSRPRR